MDLRPRYHFFDWLLIALFSAILINFRLVDYGFGQLLGQLTIIRNSSPVEQVLADPAVSDSLKSKLRYIQDVERFGVDSLGLKPTENYRTFYDQHGEPLLWVVTASEPYALEPYTWDFPLLGEVSYKGFFDPAKAEKLAGSLSAQQYDVYHYEVGAWSTLGWFSDPILSGMLWRDEGRLAELILHELTHATVYLKSSVDLNENLASFVGEQGAIRYLSYRFGPESAQIADYKARLSDDDRLKRHLVYGAHVLDSLYSTPAFRRAGSEKEQIKKSAIAGIVQSLDTVSFLRPERFRRSFKGRNWNNAHFLSFMRYDAQKDSLLAVMQGADGGSLKRFVASLLE